MCRFFNTSDSYFDLEELTKGQSCASAVMLAPWGKQDIGMTLRMIILVVSQILFSWSVGVESFWLILVGYLVWSEDSELIGVLSIFMVNNFMLVFLLKSIDFSQFSVGFGENQHVQGI